jgi:hypothetical protein
MSAKRLCDREAAELCSFGEITTWIDLPNVRDFRNRAILEIGMSAKSVRERDAVEIVSTGNTTTAIDVLYF